MTRAAASDAPRLESVDGYLRRSELPLHSLVFLLPFLIVFEVGTWIHPSSPIALHILQTCFEHLGASGRFLPALALVGILLAWHIARGDPWKVRIEILWGMAMECWALSIPLLILAVGVSQWNMHIPLFAASENWRDETVLSVGAGIYEEFVFRLILMTLVMVLAADVFKIPQLWANLLMVGTSAILFSLYHYLGVETFETRTFIFRALAGIYFAILFLNRGFGITAGCHVFYDIFVVALGRWAIH